MVEQASVLYDFSGLPESGEICLKEGDIINVTNKNIGDGWWEGSTSDGQVGLFPEAYVQLIPVANDINGTTLSSSTSYTYAEEFPSGVMVNPIPDYESYNTLHTQPDRVTNNGNDDDNDDDWDDSSSVATTATMKKQMSSQYGTLAQDVSYSASDNNKISRAPSTMSKNFNRFSSFVKHGGEDYILGKAVARVKQTDQIQIVMDEEGPRWKENEHDFTCVVENPKQQSKMKGLKKFICYNLTPSDTAVTVQRRYKQFDWLYSRLVERYPLIAIPRLPDKQASGRFEEDFIEGRMAKLKLWVAFICRHPVLSRSQLFRNFLTLTEQKAWKMSKRQAEKDQLTAANFFLTVALPSTVTTLSDAEAQLDLFKKTAKGMDEAMSQYSSMTQNMSHKYMTIFKKEYQSFGRSLTYLADSFSLHLSDSNKDLTQATKQAGQTYSRIGEMFAEQPREDFIPMTDRLWLYKGLLDAMPDLWHVQTGAMRKVKECRKLTEEGKMTEAECGAVAERTDRVACCMRSEISHFHQERIRDFTIDQRDLILKQAEFFEKIAAELRATLSYFDKVYYDP